MNIKKDKPKVYIYLTLVMLLVIAGITGFSYAYWLKHFEQRDENIIASSCFELTITEEQNDINLVGAKPISDEEGKELVPYTFRINNTCEVYGYVDVNLEIMDLGAEVKEILPEHIHAQLLKSGIELFDDVLNLEYETEPTLPGAHLSYRLNRQFIKANTYEDYELRLWMDKDVTNDDLDTIGGSFKSKVSIIMHQTDPLFERSGTIIPYYDSNTGVSNGNKYIWKYNHSVTDIIVENALEDKPNAFQKWDMSEEQDGSVIAQLVPNTYDSSTYTLYLQGIGGIKMPEDCNNFFSFFKATSIKNMELLDFSNVTNLYYAFSYFGQKATEDINLDLSSINASNVTNMQDMFYSLGSSAQKDINIYLGNDFNAKNCVNFMNFMYSVGRGVPNHSNINIDLGANFNAESAQNVLFMFAWIGAYANNLESVNINLGENFNLKNVSKLDQMFYNIGCSSSAHPIVNINLGEYFNCENSLSVFRTFYGVGSYAKEINIDFGDNFNAKKIESFREFIYDVGEESTGKITIDFGKNFGGDSATDFTYFFYYLGEGYKNDAADIDINFGDYFNTSNATNMSYMFYRMGYCSNEKIPNIDLGNNFDTSNVTDVSYMFSNSRVAVNLSDFNFKSVTNIRSFMYDANNLYGHIYIDFEKIKQSSNYDFYSTSVVTTKKVYLDYSTATESLVDDIIASYDSEHCLVQKGNKVSEYTVVIDDSNVSSNKILAPKDTSIILSTTAVNKIIKSFKLNGETINGRTFIMPNEDVEITDVEYYEVILPSAITTNITQDTKFGDEIILSTSLENKIIKSFKMNGETINGRSFIMPNENVTITDIEYYEITIPNTITTNASDGKKVGDEIILTPIEEGKVVISFKLNGTLINGNTFIMPDEDVEITDVEFVDIVTIESEHNPYANNINYETYYENTFEGATSLTVELTYQTESTSYDWIYLYDTDGSTTPYGGTSNKYGGKTLTTQTITLNSDYIKIVFRTDSSGNDYYGFKAVITPNFD